MKKIVSLVRSFRSYLAATQNEAVNWPVIVLPWPFSPKPWDCQQVEWDQDIIDALRALNRLNTLPLPFERCTILWDEVALPAFSAGLSWHAWVIDAAPNWPVWDSESEVAKIVQNSAAGILAHYWYRTAWYPSPVVMYIWRRPPAERYYPVQSDRLARHVASQEARALCGLPADWVPFIVHEKPPHRPLVASPVDLEPFARLVSPCGYLLRSSIHEPYGPPVIRDDLWRQPFYTLINWDRLYRESEGACGTRAPPRPHDRHGHVRRLWKKAGIDRRTLPPSAAERLRLSEARKVPLVYVKECKVRPAVFWFDELAAHEESDWGPDNSFRRADESR